MPYLLQKRAQEPVGGPCNLSGRTSVDEMGRISELDVPRFMRESSNLPILSGFSFSMPGNSFEADISGLIPIPTTNIQPIPPLKSDGKLEITPQPIGMQHTWSCSSCNTAMEHEWRTCSTCGKLKDGVDSEIRVRDKKVLWINFLFLAHRIQLVSLLLLLRR